MIEIATVFGRNKMKTCAVLHGATFECTIPTVGEKGFPLSQIVSWSISESRDYRRSMDPEFRDTIKFLESCLDLDPKKRLSAKEALAHPFLIEETYSDTEADEMDVL